MKGAGKKAAAGKIASVRQGVTRTVGVKNGAKSTVPSKLSAARKAPGAKGNSPAGKTVRRKA